MRIIEVEGGTVTFRDREEITVRHRQALERAGVAAGSALAKVPDDKTQPGGKDWQALGRAGLTDAEWEAVQNLQNRTILLLLLEWSFPEPVPKTLDDVLDMPASRFDLLERAFRALPEGALWEETSFEPTDPAAAGFDATPTLASSDSVGGSNGAPASATEPATSAS